jgi:hypothetical protein
MNKHHESYEGRDHHYAISASTITKKEKETLRKLVGTGTMHTYKFIKKAMMAEPDEYVNGKRYV